MAEAALRRTLGYTFATLEDFPAAESQLRRQRQLLRRAVDADDPKLLDNAHLLQHSLVRQGKLAEALPFLEQSVKDLRTKFGTESIDTLSTMLTYARYYVRAHKKREGESLFREILDIVRRTRTKDHGLALICEAELGSLYFDSGRFEEAEKLLTHVLDVRRRTLPPNHKDTLTAMNNLARLYMKTERQQDATELFRPALLGSRERWGPNHRETLICQLNFIQVLVNLQSFKEAEVLCQDVLPRVNKTFRDDEVFTVDPLIRLAYIYAKKGESERAVKYFDKVISHAFVSANPHLRALKISDRGKCLTQLTRFSAAELDLLQAEELLGQEDTVDHESVVQVRTRLTELYEAWGKPKQAAKWQTKLPADE